MHGPTGRAKRMRPGWQKGLEDKELDGHELFLEESDGPDGPLRGSLMVASITTALWQSEPLGPSNLVCSLALVRFTSWPCPKRRPCWSLGDGDGQMTTSAPASTLDT